MAKRNNSNRAASAGLRQNTGTAAVMDRKATSAAGAAYHKITPKQAKAMMDAGEAAMVLDVREPFEYNAGHIEHAVSLPAGRLAAEAAALLPDKNAKILVYCLSGGRSMASAFRLVQLGYTQVYDFGGILDWPYGIVIE